MKEEILPSEKEVFNAIIEQLFKKYDALEEINKQQAIEIANLKSKIRNAREIIEIIQYNETYGKKYIDYNEILEALGEEE